MSIHFDKTFFSDSYLRKCDLVNKYNLKSSHIIPKIDKIIFSFNVNELAISKELQELSEKDQIRSYLLAYLYSSFTPFIDLKVNKIGGRSSKQSKKENFYSLKYVLSRDEDIQRFLIGVFLDNFSNFNKAKSTFGRKNDERYQSKFSYSMSLPAEFLNEFLDLKNYLFENQEKKKFSVNVTFSIVNTPKTVKDKNTLIDNISLLNLKNFE
jgi:hypothetical protein